jgi:hypothetical protein
MRQRHSKAGAISVDTKAEAQIILEALQVVTEVFETQELTDNEKRELLSRVVDNVYPTDDLDTYAVNLKRSPKML